jgi:hypothetical protein
MFLIIYLSLPPVIIIHALPIITVLHYGLPPPNCIYTREGEYANCNHQNKHFKEVTHEKNIE